MFWYFTQYGQTTLETIGILKKQYEENYESLNNIIFNWKVINTTRGYKTSEVIKF